MNQLADISERVVRMWEIAIDQYIKKIIKYVIQNKKGTEFEDLDSNDIYEIVFVYVGNKADQQARKDLYRTFKQAYDYNYKLAHVRLVRVLPQIKKLWTDFISQYELLSDKLTIQEKNMYKELYTKYKNNLKVNNNKIATDFLGFDLFTGKKTGQIPEDKYDLQQTLIYALYDFS